MKLLERMLAGSVAKPKAILWSTAAWGLLALAAVLPLGLLSFYSYRIAATSMHELVTTNNYAVAAATAELMSRELERRLDLVKACAAMPGFVSAVEQHDEDAVRARLRVTVTNHPGIDRAAVADRDAVLWSDYPRAPEVLGERLTERDWYRGVTNGWKPYVSEVFLRRAPPRVLVVAVAAPIRRNESVLGILVHHYRLEAITGWLKDLQLGNNGCVFVIDHTGTVAAHSRFELALQTETFDDYERQLAVRAALAGFTQKNLDYLDPLLQERMVATFVPLKVASKRWVVVTAQPIKDAYAPLGRLRRQVTLGAGVLGLVAAIGALLLGRATERNRRLRRQLGEERNFLRSLVDTLPDLVYVKDIESRFILGNVAAARLIGAKSPDAIVGKRDADIFPPEQAERYRAEEASICRSGLPLLNQEEAVVDREGTRQWLSTTKVPLRDSQRRVVGVVGTGRDITRRKLAEEALRTSEARLQAILDNTTAVVYLKDLDGRYLLINRQFEALFGVKRERMVGKTDYDIFPKDMADAFRRNDRSILEGGLARQFEEIAPHDDGPHTYVSVKFPLQDPAGRVYAVCGISTDITDRKRAEAEVQRARQLAEQASQAKSEFLANMSHELRTPLNSVIGFANILLKNRGGRLQAEELEFLERIVANGKRLLALINQILDLSKIEARRMEMERGVVALDQLVSDVLAQFESQVRGRPLTLSADLPRPMAPLLTDEDKLRQVLVNLVGNALKFTEHGRVTVRVAVDDVSRRPVRIEVSDTGIGIPEDRQEVIFEAFRQADASTTRRYGGSGLGLTISKALCELMGCRLEVRSAPGQGSTFSVVLPQAGAPPPHTGPPREPRTATSLPVKAKRILVIDDDADSRALLSDLGRECGCEVVAAPDGDTGLQMAKKRRPDLILLDLLMPRLDGWAVLQRLKTDAELHRVPVVVVSMVGAESRGTLLGAWAVLQKPVTREDLLRVLQAFPHPKVLVVEDNEDHRRLMAEHLAGQAAEVALAANGEEGLRTLASFQPDVVVLDLTMPHMDGMSFLSALRKDPRYSHLPVLVVTAKDISLAERERLSQEAQAVLRKSNDWGEELGGLVNRLLKAPPLSVENPKSEIRNPKQIQNSNFEIVSDLDIRDSHLTTGARGEGQVTGGQP